MQLTSDQLRRLVSTFSANHCRKSFARIGQLFCESFASELKNANGHNKNANNNKNTNNANKKMTDNLSENNLNIHSNEYFRFILTSTIVTLLSDRLNTSANNMDINDRSHLHSYGFFDNHQRLVALFIVYFLYKHQSFGHHPFLPQFMQIIDQTPKDVDIIQPATIPASTPTPTPTPTTTATKEVEQNEEESVDGSRSSKPQTNAQNQSSSSSSSSTIPALVTHNKNSDENKDNGSQETVENQTDTAATENANANANANQKNVSKATAKEAATEATDADVDADEEKENVNVTAKEEKEKEEEEEKAAEVKLLNNNNNNNTAAIPAAATAADMKDDTQSKSQQGSSSAASVDGKATDTATAAATTTTIHEIVFGKDSEFVMEPALIAQRKQVLFRLYHQIEAEFIIKLLLGKELEILSNMNCFEFTELYIKKIKNKELNDWPTFAPFRFLMETRNKLTRSFSLLKSFGVCNILRDFDPHLDIKVNPPILVNEQKQTQTQKKNLSTKLSKNDGQNESGATKYMEKHLSLFNDRNLNDISIEHELNFETYDPEFVRPPPSFMIPFDKHELRWHFLGSEPELLWDFGMNDQNNNLVHKPEDGIAQTHSHNAVNSVVDINQTVQTNNVFAKSNQENTHNNNVNAIDARNDDHNRVSSTMATSVTTAAPTATTNAGNAVDNNASKHTNNNHSKSIDTAAATVPKTAITQTETEHKNHHSTHSRSKVSNASSLSSKQEINDQNNNNNNSNKKSKSSKTNNNKTKNNSSKTTKQTTDSNTNNNGSKSHISVAKQMAMHPIILEIVRYFKTGAKKTLSETERKQCLTQLKAIRCLNRSDPNTVPLIKSLLAQCKLTPGMLDTLVLNQNLEIVVELYLILSLHSLDSNTMSLYYQYLVDMDIRINKLSLPAMPIFQALIKIIPHQIPKAFICAYISNGVKMCEDVKDPFYQTSMVRFMCVFISHLLKIKVISIQDIICMQIKAFCLEFSRIREAQKLFQVVKNNTQ